MQERHGPRLGYERRMYRSPASAATSNREITAPIRPAPLRSMLDDGSSAVDDSKANSGGDRQRPNRRSDQTGGNSDGAEDD